MIKMNNKYKKFFLKECCRFYGFNKQGAFIHNQISSQDLNPHFVTGFIDAEGCFHISLTKNLNLNLKLSVRAIFQIALHKKDQGLLEKLRKFFGVGKVIVRSDGAVCYQVSSLEDLLIIIKHLDNYPLITQK